MNATTKIVKYGYVFDAYDKEGKESQKAGRASINVTIPNTLTEFSAELCDLFKSGAMSDRTLTKVVKRAHRVCRKGVYDKASKQYVGALNGAPLRDLIRMFGGKECPPLLKPAKARVKKFLTEYCNCSVSDDGDVTIKVLSPEREQKMFEIINDPALTVMTAKFTVTKRETSVYSRVTDYLGKALKAAKKPEEQAYISALIKANTEYLTKANLM